jgi:hypothetical protein
MKSIQHTPSPCTAGRGWREAPGGPVRSSRPLSPRSQGEGVLIALALLVTTGCGYRFTAPNSELPAGIRSVYVPVFTNKTPEVAAELLFTSAAKDQLARANRLGGESSDAVLEGTITTITSGVTFGSPELPRQPVFRLSVALTLVLKKGGATVSSTAFVTNEEFPSGADVLLTESNRSAALKRVADTAMREGLERLQSN